METTTFHSPPLNSDLSHVIFPLACVTGITLVSAFIICMILIRKCNTGNIQSNTRIKKEHNNYRNKRKDNSVFAVCEKLQLKESAVGNSGPLCARCKSPITSELQVNTPFQNCQIAGNRKLETQLAADYLTPMSDPEKQSEHDNEYHEIIEQ